MKKVKLRKMGGSVGTTLPKEIVEALNLEPGDEVYLVEKDGGIWLAPFDPAFEEMADVYSRGARKYRNALRELAKADTD